MGVLRLYHWGDKERRDGAGGSDGRSWSAAGLEARLSAMGAKRAGLWRLHCSVFSLKLPRHKSAVDAGAAAPVTTLFLLKSEGRTFALQTQQQTQQLLQGGPELQHILTQAMTVKGAPPPKPRLSGSIVRVLETARPTELRARVETTHA
jgi:hypothetical protein